MWFLNLGMTKNAGRAGGNTGENKKLTKGRKIENINLNVPIFKKFYRIFPWLWIL